MKIDFSKKIYKIEPIQSAIDAYSSVADFSISNKKNKIEVTLDNIDEEVKDIILDEFKNYALYEHIINYKHGKN